MRARVIGLLVVVLALPATAAAQDPAAPPPTPTPTPTVTPTPTPTPTPEEIEQAEERERLRKKKVVRSVYADFRRDGRIDACEHERKSLRMTLRSIDDEFEQDYPEFRESVEAAIKTHDRDRCVEEEEEAQPPPANTPAPTPAPTTPPPATTPAPTPAPTTPPPPPPSTDDGSGDSGAIPPPPKSDDSEPPTPPPTEGDVTPVQPAPTEAPPAAPPPPAEAQLAVTRPGQDPNLLFPAVLLAAALLGLVFTGGSALAARSGGTGRLAGWGHAWREAGYRATGAWSDFGDWLRLGR
jgi:hypothetical protein